MTRSSYVYIVRDDETGTIQGAFTVKREMHETAERRDWYGRGLKVIMMTDGPQSECRASYPLTRET